MLFGVEQMVTLGQACNVDARFFEDVLATPPRVEAHLHRGAWVLVHLYAHRDGEAIRALTRVEVDGDRIARLHNYFYSPELIAEVAGELGFAARSNGQRWWR